MIAVPDDLIPAAVDLLEVEGNSSTIVGAVARGLRRAGNTREVIDAFRVEAPSGDYDHVIETALAYTEGSR